MKLIYRTSLLFGILWLLLGLALIVDRYVPILDCNSRFIMGGFQYSTLMYCNIYSIVGHSLLWTSLIQFVLATIGTIKRDGRRWWVFIAGALSTTGTLLLLFSKGFFGY